MLEVLIALLILAMSLTVLLSSQTYSMAAASRSRDLTVATLLARSKMIDIERKLIHDGFQTGTLEDSGDFKEEGEAKAKWHYKVTEVELDMSLITDLCEGYNKGKDGKDKPAPSGGVSSASANSDPCSTMAGALSSQMQQLATGIGQSMRVVDLTVNVPNTNGGAPSKNQGEKVEIRTLVTREDMNVQNTAGIPGLDPTLQNGTTAGTAGTAGTSAGTTTGTTGTVTH